MIKECTKERRKEKFFMIKNLTKNIKEKTNNGITLIALVITIIVLLILAGVSIAMLTGENGILTQSQNAKNRTAEAEAQEREDLDRQNELISNAIGLPETSDTKPFLPAGATVTNNDLNTGVTIKDSNGNEWVWIEVPKSIYTNTEYNGGTAPSSSTDYAKIESTMQNYAKDYRESGFEDTWYSEAQHGFESAPDYNNYKNSMLKSVYENGGFYIGKYEVGIKEDTYRTYETDYDTEHPTTGYTAVIQEGKYVYNWVRCNQAQELSKSLATGGRTSSLMFGIQWDLVLKHIETKKGKTKEELKTKSTDWGNYYDATFDINKGKYSEDYGKTYKTVSGTYQKQENDEVLLTTGATSRNSTLNIYDLAGNVWDWTLEQYTSDSRYPCAIRGGAYDYYDYGYPASDHAYHSTTYSKASYGFSPVLWKN